MRNYLSSVQYKSHKKTDAVFELTAFCINAGHQVMLSLVNDDIGNMMLYTTHTFILYFFQGMVYKQVGSG